LQILLSACGIASDTQVFPDKEVDMLVLSVKAQEKVLVGVEVKIMILEIRRKQVWLGFEAPPDIVILREKLINS
jgi:carbon storage regulator CsrA